MIRTKEFTDYIDSEIKKVYKFQGSLESDYNRLSDNIKVKGDVRCDLGSIMEENLPYLFAKLEEHYDYEDKLGYLSVIKERQAIADAAMYRYARFMSF